MKIIRVVCGIIYSDDKIFICRRNSDKTLGGYWEFPDGKIELKETEKEALTQELKEEMNMEVNIERFFHKHLHKYNDFTIELIAYKCKSISWDETLNDHDSYKWTLPNKIDVDKLAPADIPIALMLSKEKNSSNT